MTITDIAEPARDVELGTEVDEQQDTEVDHNYHEEDGKKNGVSDVLIYNNVQ